MYTYSFEPLRKRDSLLNSLPLLIDTLPQNKPVAESLAELDAINKRVSAR